MDGTILIADDDDAVRKVLTQAFTRAGCKVHATSLASTLMRWIREGKGDLVVSDVALPDGNGLQKLPEMKKLRPELPIILISAKNSIMTAIRAEEEDVFAYLPKPFDLYDLLRRAGDALKFRNQSKSAAAFESEDLPLVGRAPEMQKLYQLLAKVMNTDIPVHIKGESGTGKTLVARSVHDFGDRRAMPFVSLASCLLGDGEEISGLLENARGGTVVIEEVGDLGAAAQRRLTQALDAVAGGGPRILTTSQQNLERKTETGEFRRDLYFRLCGILAVVPTLRNRIEDIPLLAAHFFARAERQGFAARTFSDEALAALVRYGWPGNVRQLENFCKQLAAISPEMQISGSTVNDAFASLPSAPGGSADSELTLSGAVKSYLERHFELHGGVPPRGLYRRVLREVEEPMIGLALGATGGNKAKCATLLGINRNTLRRKIENHGISAKRNRKLL
ncbi:MAG: response regulator [Albidovulum sp.]|nr:response regulator [Albidovulum sp.]